MTYRFSESEIEQWITFEGDGPVTDFVILYRMGQIVKRGADPQVAAEVAYTLLTESYDIGTVERQAMRSMRSH